MPGKRIESPQWIFRHHVLVAGNKPPQPEGFQITKRFPFFCEFGLSVQGKGGKDTNIYLFIQVVHLIIQIVFV